MKLHKKILDKGIPDDAIPGIKGVQVSIPKNYVSKNLNASAC